MEKVGSRRFAAVWKEASGRATVIADMLGLTERQVYRRRTQVESELGITLPSGNSNGYHRGDAGGTPNEYLQRVPIDNFKGTAIVFSDCHYWPDQPPTVAHRALIEVIKDIKPKLLIANGDVFDGARLSRFPRNGWEYQPMVKDELAEATERMAEIRHAYRGARCIRTVGNHCLDETTECLTPRGWLKWNELTTSDQVLSWDNGKAIWSPINEIISRPYDGNLVRIEKNRLSMAVTPEHRVLLKRLNWKTKKYDIAEYRQANDLPWSFDVPMCAQIDNAGVDIPDAALSLVGWLLTDGHYGKHEINIFQSKLSGISAIRKILSDLGIDYSYYERQRKITAVCGRTLIKEPLVQGQFRIPARWASKIKEWLPKKGGLPDWAVRLSSRQFQILLNAIVDGDGTWSGSRKNSRDCCVIYGEEPILSSIQSISVSHGWRSRLTKDIRGHYRLWLSRNNGLRVEKTEIFEEHYSGTVWCLSVPLTNFMVRRNGSAYFTGNCIRFDRYLAMNAGHMEMVAGAKLSDHLPVWQECVSVFVNKHTMVKHRFNGGVHAAYNNTLRSGTNIVTGHTHILEVKPWGDYNGRRYGVQTGAIADVNAPQFSYTEDAPTPWCSGFAVLTFANDGMLIYPELCEVRGQTAWFRGQRVVNGK